MLVIILLRHGVGGEDEIRGMGFLRQASLGGQLLRSRLMLDSSAEKPLLDVNGHQKQGGHIAPVLVGRWGSR